MQYRKSVVKKEVKWKMIEGLDKDELVLLKFSTQDIESKLKWKHSKEFEYNGQMYDIVERSTEGDTTYYWCWWDYEETALNKQLSDVLNLALGKDTKSNKHKNALYHFCSKLFFEPQKSFVLLTQIDYQDAFSNYRMNDYVIYLSNTSPPPDFFDSKSN